MCRTLSDKPAKVVVGTGQANCRSILATRFLSKDIAEYLVEKTFNKFAQIDAAHITRNSLRNVELQHLLSTFLSDEELSSLAKENKGALPSDRAFFDN